MKTCTYNEYYIKIFSSIEEIETIRNYWKGLQNHPLTDIDFYLTIIQMRQDIAHPYIIMIMKAGVPIGLFISRIDQTEFNFKIGYKKIFTKKIRQLTILYKGILGDYSENTFKIFLHEVSRGLKKKEYDIIYFEHLNIEDITFKLVTTIPGYLNRNKNLKTYTHYVLSLPEEMSKFYKTKHRKDRLKRIIRKLENEYQDRIRYEKFVSVEDVDKICYDAEEISKKTYHRGIDAGFIDNNENRQRLILTAEKGWLKAYLLYIDDEPIAFWIGTFYKDVFYLDFTGYLQDFAKFEVGTVLYLNMIEDLCKSKIKTIDYGYGDAEYKQRFSDSKWDESTVYIFPSSIFGIIMKISKEAEVIISRFLNSMFSRVNIKKKWRKKLLKKNLSKSH